MNKGNVYSKILRFIIYFLTIMVLFVGCQKSSPSTTETGYYTKEQIKEILKSDKMLSSPLISDVKLDKYPSEDFLFNNHCFSFYRDMDYFLGFSARYNSLGSIIREYPPQIVRTIENNGQKSMYFVYETDDDTRVFIFFFETDDFQFTRGYPIIMRNSLKMKNFSNLDIGDTMKDVEKIDSTASLYKKAYDTLSDEMVKKLYVDGHEKISTIHLLLDGIVRINYDRDSEGNYIINKIISSEDFIIPVMFGKLCYKIYQEDYIK